MKFLVALACLLAVSAASPSNPYILNGQNAALGQFPFVARIPGCSASILNKRTILTAAHCVCQRPRETVEVGTVKSLQGTIYNIANTYVHPDFPTGSGCPTSRDYDLAILKTTTDIVFNNNVKPIEPFFGSPEPGPGASVISIGFGVDHNGVKNVQNFGKSTITSTDCWAAFFCTPRTPTSIGSGDSGGPMVIQVNGVYRQLGVNSAITSTNSLYANIPRHQSFIKKYL